MFLLLHVGSQRLHIMARRESLQETDRATLLGASTRVDSQADDGRTSDMERLMPQDLPESMGLNGRHVDEGRATTRLGWSTTTH